MLARQDFGRKRHPQRVQAGKHELELGQVGAVILPVAQLQKPLFVDIGIAAGGGGINAHALRLQVIDSHQLAHQFLLKRVPVRVMGEQPQHIRQSIISQIRWAQSLHPTSPQRFQSSACPLLHAIHAVICLREDMGQPDHAQCSHAQSFPVTVGGNVLVQQLNQFHALHVRDQQRNIIHTFCLYAQALFHALQLPSILKLRPDLSER